MANSHPWEPVPASKLRRSWEFILDDLRENGAGTVATISRRTDLPLLKVVSDLARLVSSGEVTTQAGVWPAMYEITPSEGAGSPGAG